MQQFVRRRCKETRRNIPEIRDAAGHNGGGRPPCNERKVQGAGKVTNSIIIIILNLILIFTPALIKTLLGGSCCGLFVEIFFLNPVISGTKKREIIAGDYGGENSPSAS